MTWKPLDYLGPDPPPDVSRVFDHLNRLGFCFRRAPRGTGKTLLLLFNGQKLAYYNRRIHSRGACVGYQKGAVLLANKKATLEEFRAKFSPGHTDFSFDPGTGTNSHRAYLEIKSRELALIVLKCHAGLK